MGRSSRNLAPARLRFCWGLRGYWVRGYWFLLGCLTCVGLGRVWLSRLVVCFGLRSLEGPRMGLGVERDFSRPWAHFGNTGAYLGWLDLGDSREYCSNRSLRHHTCVLDDAECSNLLRAHRWIHDGAAICTTPTDGSVISAYGPTVASTDGPATVLSAGSIPTAGPAGLGSSLLP